MEDNHVVHQISLPVQDNENESEEFSDRFVCCVCLDLLYKPIVLACGHISCFWCVHLSMSGVQQSHCPLCRHPYIHFPTICQMLHCLLLKLYPLAYKRRELQTLACNRKRVDCYIAAEQEKKMGHFSPQIDVQAWNSLAKQDSSTPGEPACQEEFLGNTEGTASDSSRQNNGTVDLEQADSGDDEGMENGTDEVKNGLLSQQEYGSPQQISVEDVLCVACKELLYRPVVFNCGHAYCESCIVSQDDETLRCQVCQSFHPSGFPKVSLDLCNFLDEQFPVESARRREAVQLNHVNLTASERKTSKEAEKASPWLIHGAVGCDYCGMYPIVGDRYRCKDCLEKMGFDLCGKCYNTSSKLPGRFNQQHKPEHQFELIASNMIGMIVTERLENGSVGQVRLVTERLEDGSVAVRMTHMSGIPEEDVGNRELPYVSTISEEEDDQEDGSQPSFFLGGV